MDSVITFLTEYKIIAGSAAGGIVLIILLAVLFRKKTGSPGSAAAGKAFDGLTGLINRESMMKIAELELSEARDRKMQLDLYFLPGPGQSEGAALPSVNITPTDLDVLGIFSCGILEIDDLPRINETYGNNMGELVIMRLSRMIMDPKIFKQRDIRGSMGGGRFIILFPGIPSSHAAERMENFKAKWIEEMFVSDKKETFAASFCCGIAHFTGMDSTIQSVMDRAVIALDKARAERPGTVKVFEDPKEQQHSSGGFGYY